MTDPVFESLYAEELYHPAPKPAVVIGTPWDKITAPERELLSKILGSVKLSLESVRIVEQKQFNLSTWIEKPKKVICFSPAPSGLAKHEVIEVEGTSLVLSNSIADLIPDDVTKRKLWLALKQLFLA